MSDSEYRIETVTSVPFDENTFIASKSERSDCVVFDPGLEPGRILELLDSRQRVPAAILCTHGHSDHIAGNAALREVWPDCPIVIGRGDAPMLTDPTLNLSASFGVSLTSPPADRLVDEGDVVEVAGFTFDVYAIPGHSPGHVVYYERTLNPPHLFGGDVLFRGSVGRSDFPGGSFEQLRAGIHDKLFVLPESTLVFPGHGPPTTIAEEQRTNPFVGRGAG